MNVENPIAFSFIMQDDLYLLNKDKIEYNSPSLPQPVVKTQAPVFNYLGGNKKKFLALVYYPDQEFMEESHLTALQSVLKRLEFNLDDVAILNRSKYPDHSFDDLFSFFKPAKLLLLGARALPEGAANLAINKIQQLNNCSTLSSFSFGEMMDNNEKKKTFWEQMKQL